MLAMFGGTVSQAGIAADASAGQTLYPAGSQQSFKGPESYFTGEVRVDVLFPDNETAHYSGAYVTFQPGARTAWHLHPAGQHMIVTSGVALTGTGRQGHRLRRRRDGLVSGWHRPLARRDAGGGDDAPRHHRQQGRRERGVEGKGQR
jgi:hypothetical protein